MYTFTAPKQVIPEEIPTCPPEYATGCTVKN